MSDTEPTPAQLARLALWLDMPEARRARVLGGLVSTALYRLQCVESPPLAGMEARDPELIAEAEADIAAALALGWTDDGTVARLRRARDARNHWTAAKR